jgi:hypothetical protein
MPVRHLERVRAKQAPGVDDLDAEQASLGIQVENHAAVESDHLTHRLARLDVVDQVHVGGVGFRVVLDSHGLSVVQVLPRERTTSPPPLRQFGCGPHVGRDVRGSIAEENRGLLPRTTQLNTN